MSRAVWFALEAGFNGDESFDTLGEEFGPAGPLAVITVMGHAKMQGNDGTVKMTFRQLAALSWLSDKRDASQIVNRAADLDIITDYEQSERGFVARFSEWAMWQGRLDAAERQRRKRERDQGSDEGERDASQIVTEQNRTGQERTEQKKKKVAPSRDDAPLSHLLADLLGENDPDGLRPEPGKAWADAERLMISKDGRQPAQVEWLIRWCQADDFERANVRSIPKLRTRYAALWQKASKDRPRAVDGKRPRADYDAGTIVVEIPA